MKLLAHLFLRLCPCGDVSCTIRLQFLSYYLGGAFSFFPFGSISCEQRRVCECFLLRFPNGSWSKRSWRWGGKRKVYPKNSSSYFITYKIHLFMIVCYSIQNAPKCMIFHFRSWKITLTYSADQSYVNIIVKLGA